MSNDSDRLKIAIQKSGRLTDESLDMLERCGFHFRRSKDQLFCFGENMPIDLLLVRDDDIPGLVIDDVCDLGIVGRNVIDEKRLLRDANSLHTGFKAMRNLDFGHCRLSLAAPMNETFDGPADLQGKRIATSYPGVLDDYLRRHDVAAEIVVFAGAVEIAPRLGRADFICDLVSTGSTLAANQLQELVTILESEALLIRTDAKLSDTKQLWIDRLMTRIDGVQQVRESKYIMLHAPRSALPEIRRLLPGSEAPTIIPLEGTTDKVAVHAVCRENVFWETLETLKEAGASALLVLPVEKMLS